MVVGKKNKRKENREISNFICFHLLDHRPLSMASGLRMMSCEATVVVVTHSQMCLSSFRQIIVFLDQQFK